MADSADLNSVLEKLQNKATPSELTIKHFQKAVDDSYNPTFITDPDGICVYVNKAVEKVTGFKKEEIFGKKVGAKDLWGGVMDQAFYKNLWDTIKVKKSNFTGEITNKRKNGELYSSLIHITPSLNDGGDVEFFVSSEQDISEQKIAEEQITKVLTDLEE